MFDVAAVPKQDGRASVSRGDQHVDVGRLQVGGWEVSVAKINEGVFKGPLPHLRRCASLLSL